METKYQSYIDKITRLENAVKDSKQEYKKQVQTDLIEAFSKYFIVKKLEDVNIDISNKSSFSNELFFLNDGYGLIFELSEHYWSLFTISIKIIYKNLKLNKFIISSTLHRYQPTNNEDPLKLAENLYEDLKVRNEKRIKNKKQREFKKQINKFNL